MSEVPAGGTDTPEALETESEELADELRFALKGGAAEPAAPDVLAGFQKKLRQRSRGKFYEDGWSTSRHAPINTYLITSLMMLAVLGIIYALLAPLSGEPVPVENTPQPVQIISPK
jgi:hypothetical protein